MSDDRRIELVALDDVFPAQRNPKDHDLGAIHGSVARFGYVEPMVMDERTERLVAGHGRLETLRAMKADGQHPPEGVQLGPKGEWLVPVLRGWSSRTDAEAQAYLLASNRTTELGGWDENALADLLKELAQSGDLEGSGYDGDDVDALLARLEREALKAGGAGSDEGIADGVKMATCPECGEVFHPA